MRDRLTQVFNNNGRVEHWKVALDAWRGRAAPRQRRRHLPEPLEPGPRRALQVLDAHSLYFEMLGELGLVGLALLLAGAAHDRRADSSWRLRGPARPSCAAVLAALAAWSVHAGVDWDWEMAAITVWVFGLGGLRARARA